MDTPERAGWRLRSAQAWMCGAVAGVLFLTGCKTSYYQKEADRQTYKIIEQAEQQVFGKRTPFSIETRYSDKKPDEVLAVEIIAERQEPDTLFLTLEEALKLAVKNSREYQSQKEELYLKALTLTGTRYEFSPHFLAGSKATWASFEQQKSKEIDLGTNRVTVTSTPRELNQSVNSQFSVSQMLKSGGSLSASLASDFLRYYTGDPRRSLLSSISINLVQPLMRGAGTSIATENLKQAERNVIYAMRSFSQYQRQFAVDVVLDYYGLLRNKDQVRNAYADYQRRLETIRYTEARGEAGKQSQLEVDEAKSEELTAKNSYISAATTYLNNLDQFKLTLGIPLTTKIKLDDRALTDLREVGLPALRLDRPAALKVAIQHQLELLNAIDSFEDSKRKIQVAADALKADLNIFADASLRSHDEIDYTKFDLNDVRAGAGIELDLPIDRTKERNFYRTTLVNFESAIRTLSRELDTKKDQLDRGLRNLESLRRAYDIQRNSVTIAERRVAGEQLSLQAGRRTVRNVRDAQDALVQAQNDLTQYLVQHLEAKLQLFLDIGILNTDLDQFWVRSDAVLIPLEQIQATGEDLPPLDEIVPPDRIFEL